VLGVDASAMSEDTVTSMLVIPQAIPRVLDRDKFKDLLKSGRARADVSDAYRDATFVMVVADVVVTSMSVKICKTSKTDAKVAAALNSSVGKVVGKDAKLALSIARLRMAATSSMCCAL